MGLFTNIAEGMAKSRDKFKESMNVLLQRGPNLDEDFWDDLEETLVLSDIGGVSSMKIVENLRDRSTRMALSTSYEVLDLLSEQIVDTFATTEEDPFDGREAIILFVGINGTGKTTTVGKLAKEAKDAGRKAILGSADTFRAAAIEQLQVWADRSGVEMVTRERGSDPASVCYDTIERAEEDDCDLVLIDTAGRLHTSDDLMRELVKVVNVTRKRANVPVYVVLVIDATTGQNGMQQAREFNKALDLDGLIITKLDGTAKGGIALAISSELDLPVFKIGVGEGIDDLRDFNPEEFVAALIGDFEQEDLIDSVEDVEAELETEAEDADVEAEEPLSTEEVEFEVDEEQLASDIEEAASDEEPPDSYNEPAMADEEPSKMSWDEFVKYDDKLKEEGTSSKKHFWEKW